MSAASFQPLSPEPSPGGDDEEWAWEQLGSESMPTGEPPPRPAPPERAGPTWGNPGDAPPAPPARVAGDPHRPAVPADPPGPGTRLRVSEAEAADDADAVLGRWRGVALDQLPANPAAAVDLGFEFAAGGHWREAIAALEGAVEDRGYGIAAAAGIAEARIAVGEALVARRTAEQALQRWAGLPFEQTVDLRYWYARANEAGRFLSTAVTAYQEILDAVGAYRDVGERHRRLRASTDPWPGEA